MSGKTLRLLSEKWVRRLRIFQQLHEPSHAFERALSIAVSAEDVATTVHVPVPNPVALFTRAFGRNPGIRESG